MNVDRCVCFSLTFEELKKIAQEHSLDFKGLRERTLCTRNCRMCEPFIRKMLETGETVFILDRKNPAPVAGVTKVVGLGTPRAEGKSLEAGRPPPGPLPEGGGV